MPGTNDIVALAKENALGILRARLASWIAYHDVRHTEETVEACREIAAGCGLDPGETEVVLIAAWFHDTGYTETVEGHEERSAALAEAFLRDRGYPEEKIRRVRGCILATRMPQKPEDLAERVICDADMLYNGREEFFAKNDALREEIERREGIVIDPAAWLRRSIAFLEGLSYHTEYCRGRLAAGVKRNIETLRRQLVQTRP